jgi:hypothetical protein
MTSGVDFKPVWLSGCLALLAFLPTRNRDACLHARFLNWGHNRHHLTWLTPLRPQASSFKLLDHPTIVQPSDFFISPSRALIEIHPTLPSWDLHSPATKYGLTPAAAAGRTRRVTNSILGKGDTTRMPSTLLGWETPVQHQNPVSSFPFTFIRIRMHGDHLS